MRWTAELRKIERQFDGLPPAPSPALLRARKATERRTRERREQALTAVASWGRVLLIGVLAAAIYYWPYPRSCGTGLFAYVGAEALIVLGGVWAMIWTWRARMGLAHAFACLMVLVGCAFVSAQVLPRVGYAKVSGPQVPRWGCTPAEGATHAH